MDLKSPLLTPIHWRTSPQPEQTHAISLIPCKRENDALGVPDETGREKRPRSAPSPTHERARFMAQYAPQDAQNDLPCAENKVLSLEEYAARRSLAQEAEPGLQALLDKNVPPTLAQVQAMAHHAPFLEKIDVQQRWLDAVFHYLDQAPQAVIEELAAIVNAEAGLEPALEHPVLKELAAGLHNIGMTDTKERAVILLGCFAAEISPDTTHDALANLLDILEQTPKDKDAKRAFSQQGFIVNLEERIADHVSINFNFMIEAFAEMVNPSVDRKKAGRLGIHPLLCERFCALAQKHSSRIDSNGATDLFWNFPDSMCDKNFPAQYYANALSLLRTVAAGSRWDERNSGTFRLSKILAEGILGSDVKSQEAILDIFSDSKDFFDSVLRREGWTSGHEAYKSVNKAIDAGYIDSTLLPRARDLAAELYKIATHYERSDSESEDAMSMYSDEETDFAPQQNEINERPAGKQLIQAG